MWTQIFDEMERNKCFLELVLFYLKIVMAKHKNWRIVLNTVFQ